MFGTLRLTKAEFKKIFRRPSVFLVALLILATIFVSIQFFNPQPRENYSVIYDYDLTSDYYNYFNNDSGYDSKRDIDPIYEKALNFSNYYVSYYDRGKYLEKYYSEIFTTFDALKNEENSTLKNEKYTAYKIALKTFKDKYLDFTGLDNYSHISKLLELDQYTKSGCFSLDTLITATETNSYSSIINYVETNNYEDKNTGELYKVYKTAKNPIYTTISLMSANISATFSDYYRLIEEGVSRINLIESKRKDLLKFTNEFLDYINNITNSEYPIILIDKDILNHVTHTLEYSISKIENVNDNNYNQLNTHKEIKEYLKSQSYPQLINDENLLKYIHEVNINESLSQEFLEINVIVENNREVILKDIEEVKVEDDIKPISNEITRYKLLATTYQEYILNKTMYTVVDKFSPSEYNNFYNYDFETFNKYQYNERISTNKYYIDNNIYENDFLTVPNSDISSDTKTNMFDFMYFALELCTLVIIIFSMMLICNLITNETESGTIKLLLIRPYKRSKILTSKILATILLVITFMIFSTILTGVAGFVLYGYTTKSVLAVFNSTTVFTASPILIMSIKILALLADTLFYVFVALMLAMIVKNYAGAISSTIVLFIMNFALVFIFKNSIWFLALPGINLNLFKYFGNSFIATSSGIKQGLISQILSPTLMGQMNIWISISINSIYTILFIALSYILFNKRDY